ncbi:helix-turn-helix transcriptional regulator [Marinobacter sp. P4B1]|uniref:helix-turn-helix transcriptional regulator n=1 Tax=Marinobacter sp. P4B1 TaxID=1119533 RepID=UPI000B2740EE|nr:helix-turn-helix transcriptional regulator [Marinobacter sp. P4B1]
MKSVPLSRGILVCNEFGCIVFRNAAATDMLNRGVGIRQNPDGTLSAFGTGKARELSTMLSAAVESSLVQAERKDQVLQLRYDDQHCTLVITPLLAETMVTENVPGVGALITLYDWSDLPAIDSDLLTEMFGLTSAEVRVAGELVKGRSLTEIAESFGRSRETIKYHLRGLLRKTGTRRQGELISVLARTCVIC